VHFEDNDTIQDLKKRIADWLSAKEHTQLSSHHIRLWKPEFFKQRIQAFLDFLQENGVGCNSDGTITRIN
jgi:hypothetical protein